MHRFCKTLETAPVCDISMKIWVKNDRFYSLLVAGYFFCVDYGHNKNEGTLFSGTRIIISPTIPDVRFTRWIRKNRGPVLEHDLQWVSHDFLCRNKAKEK